MVEAISLGTRRFKERASSRRREAYQRDPSPSLLAYRYPRRPTATRASWARLLHKILEVDPLLCPRCRVEMKIVSVIIDPAVVDQILRHLAHAAAWDPFEERPPPPTAHSPYTHPTP